MIEYVTILGNWGEIDNIVQQYWLCKQKQKQRRQFPPFMNYLRVWIHKEESTIVLPIPGLGLRITNKCEIAWKNVTNAMRSPVAALKKL